MTRHALHTALAKRSANGTHWQSNGLVLRRNITAQMNGEPIPVTMRREDDGWPVLLGIAVFFFACVVTYALIP